MLTSPLAPRSIVVLALLCALGDAQAQGAAATKAPAPPLKACSAANRQAVAELSLAVEAASKRNRLNAVTMSRLHGIESQLETLKTNTARDARTQRECEQAAQSIAAEQERLQRVAGPDPQVTECMGSNQQAHGLALQALAALPEAARVHAQGLQLRLTEIKPALTREGQTLAECQQVGAAIAQERAQLTILTPPPAAAIAQVRSRAPSAPDAGSAAASAPASAPMTAADCRRLHAETYNTLVQQFTRALQASDATEAARQRLQGIGQRLSAVHTSLSGDAPGTDCKAIGQALAGIAADMQ